MSKRHINEFKKTVFANSGRAAGYGIMEDNYGDEDGPGRIWQKPSPFEHREKGENGEVIVYKAGKQVTHE